MIKKYLYSSGRTLISLRSPPLSSRSISSSRRSASFEHTTTTTSIRSSFRPYSGRRGLSTSHGLRNPNKEATAAAEEEADSENFWKVSSDDTVFWNAYVSTRPNYSRPFYDEIYNHHQAHSSSWTCAHDVGCGAGQVAGELSTKFKRVVASDINDTHVAVAQRLLAGNDRIEFTHSTGEELSTHHDHGTADLIAIAEAMVLMDSDAALASFHRLLKPGGTLAFWFYGRPTFADDDLRKQGQPIIDDIMVRNWAKIIQGSGGKRQQGFQRAADGMASWLDYVKFDHSQWKDVRRIKWNPDATLPFFGEEACGFPVTVVNNVHRDKEQVEERTDRTWWQNDWTIRTLREYFSVLFPGFKAALGQGDVEIEGQFRHLHKLMGGEQSKKSFTWPAVLVLATKR